MITSTSNEKIKRVALLQKKASLRKETGLFVAEGERLFTEIPPELIVEIYITEEKLDKSKDDLINKSKSGELIRNGCYETVSSAVFAKISDTGAPQGVLAVVRKPVWNKKLFQQKDPETPLYLILENLQDPGNMGTIFRTAEGAGVTGVILSGDCVDLFNPKTVRSTMGSLFRVPFMVAEDLHEEIRRLQNDNIPVYAADLGGTGAYDDPDYRTGCAFIIGNEGNGLRRETSDLCLGKVLIPMEGQLESLNASVAAAILMYEAGRQRRKER